MMGIMGPKCFSVSRLQKQSGKCNPKFPLDGACDVVFGVDCEETKLKNVFKLKKCFALFRRDVKMIKGTFVNNLIQVRF